MNPTDMPRHLLLRQFALIFMACLVFVSAIYFMVPSIRGIPIAGFIEWVLWPGVALWFGAGATLFNGGFGETGDFLIIVAGSAAAWAIVIVVAARTYTSLRRRSQVTR